MRLVASDDVTGGQHELGLMVARDVAGDCRGLASTAGRRIWASGVATGFRPAAGDIEAASSESRDRSHDVSILTTVVVDGW